jgi:SAM-dependent methyltransferase
VSQHVTGVDQDEGAISRARDRLALLDNVRAEGADFLSMKAEPHTYDLVTFVASIHHMDLTRALRRARNLLRPDGELVVIGLSANQSVGDYVIAALTLPAIRILSRLHHEKRDLNLVAIPPRESLKENTRDCSSRATGLTATAGLVLQVHPSVAKTRPG